MSEHFKSDLPKLKFINKLIQSSENVTCHCWEIRESSLGGRGIFAAETIKRGNLIFVNKPLVIGPRGDRAGEKYCTVCYNISDSVYTCEKCALFVCSDTCKDSFKHQKDCTFITQHWKSKSISEKNSEVLSKVLIYLKFMLLDEDEIAIFSVLQKTIDTNTEELETLFSTYTIPEEQISFMKKVSSSLKTNSYRIPSHSPKEIPLRGLYPLSSLLNHSCVPNTRKVYKKDYSMAVYASRDIESGEEILSCYTGILWSTPARRCQIYKTKHFWCKCERCKDSTEMSTKLSALKCLEKTCTGVVLQVAPLDPNTDWRCDICNTIVPSTRVSTVQSVLGSLLGTLDLDGEFRLDQPILGRLASFIPYSSHVFVDLRLRLALTLGFSKGPKLNGICIST